MRRVACCLLLTTALWGGQLRPAAAQDDSRQGIAMQNEIDELRHTVDTLRDQVAAGGGGQQQYQPPARGDGGQGNAGGAPSSDIAAQLLDRVSQLEDSVRTLQGQNDELRNKLDQQNADLGKQIGDLGFRVQALEGGHGAAPGAGQPAPGGSSPPPRMLGAAPDAAAPAPGPAVAPGRAANLQQGYAALALRDYPTAEQAARDGLANPRSPKAYDAQFLLAQSLAGQHSYQQAALAFDDTYSKSRRGAHAQDALVGLAGSLTALGEKPAACATLDKLRAEFPAQRPDVRASAASLGRRAGCR